MLSIIIPTLNEHGSLARLFLEIKDAVLHIKISVEVVIVDDGSTDGTVEYIHSVKNTFPFSVRTIVRKERGLATAVIRGIAEAKGDIVCVMDADLSHPPALIPQLLNKVLAGADIAIGSRYIKGGGVEDWPIHRRLFSYVSTILARPISKSAKDPLSGFFCVRKSMLDKVVYRVVGYKILLEILVKSPVERVVEVSYVFRNRGMGVSKLNTKIALQYFQHLFGLHVHHLKRSRKEWAARILIVLITLVFALFCMEWFFFEQ